MNKGDKSGEFKVSFTQLAECDSKLDINREPSVIRYSQVSPIIKYDKSGKKNLCFNPYHPFQNTTDKQKESAARKIVEATDNFGVGQIVGIGRSRFVAENVLMKPDMYKDNRTNDVYFQSEKGNWLLIGPSTGSWELFPFQ